MKERETPNLAAGTERRQELERQRLAEALRQNLAKRKAQGRARAESSDASSSSPSPSKVP